MLYIYYEVFEHLLLLLIGIQIHTQSITTTIMSPNLGEFAKILGCGLVKTCNYTMVKVETA